ncbi:WYL domain-containing protein [Candidatus Bipolaricaulota bacterium]|nr:WYL domain-containing protein [Candidatus Bipolaricaulota bacterium]
MRADRLLSLLMLLHTRGQLTAERLSRELEVSIRTVYRDIYALRVAGFPVYSERGTGGGCYLHEDYRMRLTDLTQDELMALFTMAVPAALVDLGVGHNAKGALLKLAAALPAARKNVESFVRNRIQLDPQSWRPSSTPVPALSLLREGVWSDRWMRVTFLRMQRIHTSREIAPLALVAKEKRWYVIWIGRDDTMHVDRASSIIDAELMEEVFERPRAFDLPSYWADWLKRHAANRPSFLVTARMESDLIPSLISELGSECVHRLEEANGRALIRLSFEYFQQARSIILRYGGSIEVITPEALRRSISDFAEQTLAVYRAP